jgi:hypothetical protein
MKRLHQHCAFGMAPIFHPAPQPEWNDAIEKVRKLVTHDHGPDFEPNVSKTPALYVKVWLLGQTWRCPCQPWKLEPNG